MTVNSILLAKNYYSECGFCYTLFFIGPNIPGGSCSLSVQVIPLSYERFMNPLHLK